MACLKMVNGLLDKVGALWVDLLYLKMRSASSKGKHRCVIDPGSPGPKPNVAMRLPL